MLFDSRKGPPNRLFPAELELTIYRFESVVWIGIDFV